MSAKHSHLATVAVADAALGSPVYYTLRQLRVARFSAEQGTTRAAHLGDDGFARHVPSGEREVSLVLEGYSDGSDGEALLTSGFFGGARRLLRFDTAQGERVSGEFSVVRFTQEARGDELEQMRVELRSHGTVTFG